MGTEEGKLAFVIRKVANGTREEGRTWVSALPDIGNISCFIGAKDLEGRFGMVLITGVWYDIVSRKSHYKKKGMERGGVGHPRSRVAVQEAGHFEGSAVIGTDDSYNVHRF